MAQSNAETPPGMPRWVKVFVLIVILLILLVVVLKLTGIGGDHGPGRHAPGMLTGFALLAVGHGPRCPVLRSDTAAGDVIPSEDDY